MRFSDREGLHLSPIRWVLNAVGENDVVVIDIFGKVKNTFIGDNLAFGVSGQKGAGLIIDGGIRDPGGVYDAPNINVFCRGSDPGVAVEYYTLSSLNGVTRIGEATVLPGDIVLGTGEGVIFIPPHLVEEVVTASEAIRLQDEFRRQRLVEGKYTTEQCYVHPQPWSDEIEADFQEWCKELVIPFEEIRLQDQFRSQRLAEGKYTKEQCDRPLQLWPDEIEADFQEWCKQRRS